MSVEKFTPSGNMVNSPDYHFRDSFLRPSTCETRVLGKVPFQVSNHEDIPGDTMVRSGEDALQEFLSEFPSKVMPQDTDCFCVLKTLSPLDTCNRDPSIFESHVPKFQSECPSIEMFIPFNVIHISTIAHDF